MGLWGVPSGGQAYSVHSCLVAYLVAKLWRPAWGLMGRSHQTFSGLMFQAPRQTLLCTLHWWNPTGASWAWTCLMGAT